MFLQISLLGKEEELDLLWRSPNEVGNQAIKERKVYIVSRLQIPWG